jgi:hypothetical protein
VSVSEAELAALIAGLTGAAATPVAPVAETPEPAPTPDGPPPSTLAELRQVLMDYEASRPRSMQKALGPSELGTPCQAQIARKLAGCPRRPVTAPTWAPWCGTQVHSGMEKVIAHWNRQLGRERWLAEARLVIHPGTDGSGSDAIRGSSDAYDQDLSMVVDWKYVGKTALTQLQRGQRMGKPTEGQVSQEYRTQAHLYGYGQERAGRDVKWVRLVLLARSHDYDESGEWTERYRPEIAVAALDRYFATIDLLNALGVANNHDMIAAVPTAASRDACKWCPFNRPGQSNSWDGCPGDRTLERVVANATAGIIA